MEVAKRLGAALDPWKETLPEGPILELGAGTGFFTQEVRKLFPTRALEVTDICREMISLNQSGSDPSPDVSYKVMDAEVWTPDANRYSLVCASFVIQWFENPARTLMHYIRALKPGGLMLLSFPGSDTFREWKKQAVELGLPYTGHQFPDTEQLVIQLSESPVQIDFHEEARVLSYRNPIQFFRHIKSVGAGTPQKGTSLSATDFRLLCRHWGREKATEVTWHLVFMAIKRDFE